LRWSEEEYAQWAAKRSSPQVDVVAVPVHTEPPSSVTKTKRWSDAEDEWLRQNYPLVGKKAAAEHLGRTTTSIRARTSRLGIKQDRQSPFAKDWQARAAQSKVGKKRPEHAATMLKLCAERGGTLYVATEESRRRMGEAQRKRLALGGHPRGALGMKHSAEAKLKISEKSAAHWAAMSEDERAALKLRQMKAAWDARSLHRPHAGTTWKSGWREIGEQRAFFRSRWEANYARYLEWLRSNGEIEKWEHEPEVFWFESIKRGTRSYLPDFRVTDPTGVAYHEVKGWMDSRSRTQIKRMGIYYPNVRLVVVDAPIYRGIAKSMASILDDWEQ
jgi:hypothetical protein